MGQRPVLNDANWFNTGCLFKGHLVYLDESLVEKKPLALSKNFFWRQAERFCRSCFGTPTQTEYLAYEIGGVYVMHPKVWESILGGILNENPAEPDGGDSS